MPSSSPAVPRSASAIAYAAAVASLGQPGRRRSRTQSKTGETDRLRGRRRQTVIGLPGNPTSALIILEAVAAPIVARSLVRRTPPHVGVARFSMARREPGRMDVVRSGRAQE